MNKYIESAIPGACFHGECWYRCPHCGRAFEFYDTEFEWNGIKKTEDEHVFKCSCGELFKLY